VEPRVIPAQPTSKQEHKLEDSVSLSRHSPYSASFVGMLMYSIYVSLNLMSCKAQTFLLSSVCRELTFVLHMLHPLEFLMHHDHLACGRADIGISISV
jgi:hypothetical protein